MKIAFEVYGRRPIGRLLSEILNHLAKHPATAARKVTLYSRSGRVGMPLAEVLASAAESATDTCVVTTEAGEISIRWMYGPRASVQSVFGRLSVEASQAANLKMLLGDLCVMVDAIYACCDEEATIDGDSRLVGGMLYREQAFVGLYWFNFFGREYREALVMSDEIRRHATEVYERGAGLCVIIGATPGDRDEESVRLIADRWPVFQRYRPGATFAKPISIDYSEVRDLEKPRSTVASIGSVVGEADAFIAAVPSHARRFHEWVATQGLLAKTEDDFQRAFRAHEPFIRDELLLPAIAAYGEVVRAKMGGTWKKADIFHRGEPVVAKAGRPWTARRVIQEVLESLQSVEE